ncbi:MAG: DUF2220 family protein [Desulfobulbaceae bacterium]|nr:DUF2220 family protein [Desulfobulbaceae bacterium]
MLSPEEIRKKTLRHWDSGRFLRAEVCGDDFFPLRIPWGKPGARRISEDFTAIRKRIQQLQLHSGSDKMGYSIQWHQIKHRRLGDQKIPAAVLFDRAGFLRCIGKEKQYSRFLVDLDLIYSLEPELKQWLGDNPLLVVLHAGIWQQLLAVVHYFKKHPKPKFYIRQLDIPGIDTKFIEGHKKILASLLDTVLPKTAINLEVTGLSAHGFERRFGLRHDQPLIRLRYLDHTLAPKPALVDLTLPLPGFRNLSPGCRRVFITENKINGLSFPNLTDAIIIFGLGYGVQVLAEVPWLAECKVYYWGDIDTHGFSILSQVRSFLPQTRSFLMDHTTLMAYRELWVREEEHKRCHDQLHHLNVEEQSLYEDLRADVPGKNVRLEQERISYSHLCDIIRQLAV